MADDSIAAVLFDVGGTLVESRPAPAFVYAEVLSRRGRVVTGDEVAPVFRAIWGEMTELHPRGLDRYQQLKGGEAEWWAEFVRRVIVRLGHEAPWRVTLAELIEAFADPALWYVFPEVPGVLAALRRRGCKVAAVSNWDSRLPALLDRLDLSAAFDAILVSAIEGLEKPAPALFHRAAERLGVSPECCLHVGDSPLDDVRGAESARMRAVLIDRHDQFRNGYTRIADLTELNGLLVCSERSSHPLPDPDHRPQGVQ